MTPQKAECYINDRKNGFYDIYINGRKVAEILWISRDLEKTSKFFGSLKTLLLKYA